MQLFDEKDGQKIQQFEKLAKRGIVATLFWIPVYIFVLHGSADFLFKKAPLIQRQPAHVEQNATNPWSKDYVAPAPAPTASPAIVSDNDREELALREGQLHHAFIRGGAIGKVVAITNYAAAHAKIRAEKSPDTPQN